MSIQKHFIKRVWNVVNLFGLQSKEMTFRQTLTKLLTFIIFLPMYVIVLIVIIVESKSQLVVTYEVYQSMPYFLLLALKCVYFKLNAKNIERVIESFVNLLEEVPEELLIKSHSRAISLSRKFAFLMFVPGTIVQILTFVRQEGFIPILIPTKFIVYEIVIRNAYFIFYGVSCYYATCLVGLVDGLIIYLLLQLEAYSEFLVQSFSEMPDQIDSRSRIKLRDSFTQFSNFHRIIVEFSNVFGPIIVVHGFQYIIFNVFLLIPSIENENIFSVDLILSTIFISLNMMWVMVPCRIGSEIDYYTQKLVTKLYETNWLDSDLKHRKNIFIMQTILQHKPTKVKALIYSLDLETSLTLINAIYSFFAIARRIKEKRIS